jgi:hypothetical protein
MHVASEAGSVCKQKEPIVFCGAHQVKSSDKGSFFFNSKLRENWTKKYCCLFYPDSRLYLWKIYETKPKPCPMNMDFFTTIRQEEVK